MKFKIKKVWSQKNAQYLYSFILTLATFFTSAAQAATCTYTVSNEWDAGFQGSITIVNNSTTAINGWTLGWQYTSSKITNSWNANLSGSNPYTASNVDWNKTIQPGQSISFGVQGNKNGGAAEKPIISGNVCSVTSSTSSVVSSVISSSAKSSNSKSSSNKSSAVSSVVFSSSVKSSSSAASSLTSSVATGQQCNWYGTLYPLCKTTPSGWGYENNKSCITAATCRTQPAPYGIIGVPSSISSVSVSSISSSRSISSASSVKSSSAIKSSSSINSSNSTSSVSSLNSFSSINSSSSSSSFSSASSSSSKDPESITILGVPTEENVSNYQLKNQGLDREFSFFRPSNPERKKLPLVIDFHGAGGVVAPTFATDYWLTIARREKFFVLKPQAATDSYVPYSYWDTGWGGRDDVLFVKTILDAVLAQQDIDTDRIYVTGMSSGGHMSFFTSIALKDQLAAVASIAGSIMTTRLSTYDFKKPMPLCKIHGNADTVVKMEGDDWYAPWSSILAVWLTNNGITNPPTVIQLPDINVNDRSTVTKYEYRGATVASDIDDYLINNGYHAIPGIESYANYDINAYEVIWEFFKKHKLSDSYQLQRTSN